MHVKRIRTVTCVRRASGRIVVCAISSQRSSNRFPRILCESEALSEGARLRPRSESREEAETPRKRDKYRGTRFRADHSR